MEESNLQLLKSHMVIEKFNTKIMYRKFLKYYRKDFIPITIYEQRDRKRTLNLFEYFKCAGFIVFFLGSKLIRRLRMVEFKLAEELFTGVLAGYSGWLLFHVLGMRYVFDSAQYIRDRLAYENSVNFDRHTVRELYNEYPFVKHNLKSDLSIRNRLPDEKL
jgi:hypothetical protein